MGDYNADPVPDTDKMHQVAHAFRFAPLKSLKVDQFSTVSSFKVYSLVQKIGSTRLHLLVDPSLLPT